MLIKILKGLIFYPMYWLHTPIYLVITAISAFLFFGAASAVLYYYLFAIHPDSGNLWLGALYGVLSFVFFMIREFYDIILAILDPRS